MRIYVATNSPPFAVVAGRDEARGAVSPIDAATATSGTNNPDWTVVRDFIRDLKIACDDLHAEPFNPHARDTVLRLLQKGSPAADSALERVARARHDPDAGHLRLLSDR